jgi:hemolysin type calcium-binding protein
MKGYLGTMPVYGTTSSDHLDFSGFMYDGLSFDYYSNGGNDIVSGGRYDDRFILNSGAETIDGRGGQDTVDYSGSTAAVRVNLSFELQHGGWAEGDRLTRIENVTGSRFGDTLYGTDGNNVIYGLGGNDAIMSGKGSDQLYGGAGQDTFKVIADGLDLVSGGADKDIFNFDVGSDPFNITITDFNPLLFDDANHDSTGPAESTIRDSAIWELFTLHFRSESGVTTQDEADAAVTYVEVGPNDHDAIVRVDTPSGTHGIITFQGLGDALHNADNVLGGDHAFTIYQHYSLL